jgi:hypothetical protein
MTEKTDDTQEPETVEVVSPETPDAELAEDPGSNWEFVNRVPTKDEVRALLAKLPPVWGVVPVDFLDYVQALPSTKKMKVWQDVPGKKGSPTKRLKVDAYFDVFTIYFSVAGRIQMLRTAQELHGWRVDFIPERMPYKDCPPGYLEPPASKRLVYREYVEISKVYDMRPDEPLVSPVELTNPVVLGRRPGTAWVPREGGTNAAGSNPYEKVETSARGRALSAWGFGVLPGSGVASVEEMLGVSQNRAAIEAEAKQEGDPESAPFDREECIATILTMSEDIAQRSKQSEGEKLDRIATYAKKTFNVEMVGAADPETGEPMELDWSRLKNGHLQLMRNSVKRKLAELIVAEKA